MLSGKDNMEDAKLQSVSVRGHDCDKCLAALKADCAAVGHPKVGAFAVVPSSWLEAECPHGRSGVFLEPVESEADGIVCLSDDEDPRVRMIMEKSGSGGGLEDQPEFQKSRWRELFPDTLDATKGIGYPAREVGRYGSHPQHDGSDE